MNEKKKLLESILHDITKLQEEKNDVERRYDLVIKEIGEIPKIVNYLKIETLANSNDIKKLKEEIKVLPSVLAYVSEIKKDYDKDKKVFAVLDSLHTLNNKHGNEIENLKKSVGKILYRIDRIEKSFVEEGLATEESGIEGIKIEKNYSSPKNNIRDQLSELSNSISEINEIMRISITKFEEEVERLGEKFEDYDLRIKLMEAMNVLYRCGADLNRISLHLREIDSIVEKMKRKGFWNHEKNDKLIEFLEDLGNAWENYGYHEISQIFFSKAKDVEKKLTTF